MGIMSIRNQRDFEKLRAIGRIVRQTLDRTAAAVRPGVTTRELDRIATGVLAEHGAESAPPKAYGFPGDLCISVNDEAIHGIPGDREIRAGDLLAVIDSPEVAEARLDLIGRHEQLTRPCRIAQPGGQVDGGTDVVVTLEQQGIAGGDSHPHRQRRTARDRFGLQVEGGGAWSGVPPAASSVDGAWCGALISFAQNSGTTVSATKYDANSASTTARASAENRKRLTP